jgi:hypothetical protein
VNVIAVGASDCAVTAGAVVSPSISAEIAPVRTIDLIASSGGDYRLTSGRRRASFIRKPYFGRTVTNCIGTIF